jgi:outer membrane PBP1 activator LpoA protein
MFDMQRIFPLQWFLLALYVSAFANATAEPLPISADKPAPYIALLLPLNSPSLGTAAEAVHQGILAAAGLQNQGLPLHVYSDYDEAQGVVAAYQRAIADGAVAVIGPLTRNAIHQLADSRNIPIPTLALNIVEGQAPPQLYFFGMAIEAEARQIALLARQQGKKQAYVITSHKPLAQRLQFAFEEQWTASGGTIAREIEYSGDTMVFADIAAMPDSMAFFATDIEDTRTIRPFLPNNLTTYATSQLFAGNRDALLNFDLQDVHFVDMPWLLHADQPAVMAYPRPNPPLAIDNERLYALGIDAYRLVTIVLAKQMASALPLFGVTGLIRLNDHTFNREGLPALFVQGHGQSADTPVAQTDPLFPNQFRSTSGVNPALTLPGNGAEAASTMAAAPTPKP